MRWLTLIFLWGLTASAANADSYVNGRELAAKYKSLLDFEKGFWVSVPIDHSDSLKGRTEIYAHFTAEFNPNLETLIVFVGGPGQSSHFPPDHKLYQFYATLGFNVLVLDQRGIAFSRPDEESLWRSRDFYSSEAVARDAEEIRKFLGIARWTVYGASYGTVPATIYASLFGGAHQVSCS